MATTLVWASPAVAATPAPRGGYSTDSGREQVLELVARQTQITFIDNDGPGTSQGDELVLAGDLLRGVESGAGVL